MAFASEVTYRGNIVGVGKLVMGKFTQGNGDTGGEIKTGLGDVKHFHAEFATGRTDPVKGAVTITTADPGGDQTGFWMAVGFDI